MEASNKKAIQESAPCHPTAKAQDDAHKALRQMPVTRKIVSGDLAVVSGRNTEHKNLVASNKKKN